MKNKEQGVEPVLKSRTFFFMNEFILGDEKAGKNRKTQVHEFVLPGPWKIQREQKDGQGGEAVQGMSQALPARKPPLLVDQELIDRHDDSLEDERKIDHFLTSKTPPIIVSPGPKAMATTGVPSSGGTRRISSQTCGSVAEDMFPRSKRTFRLAAT